jgi:hypothetical protein
MRRFLPGLFAFVFASVAQAVTLQLDYSYDAANGNFFGLTPAARAAVDAAAADISAAISPSLGAIPTDTFTGSGGLLTSATFNWRLTFDNPATGAQETLETFTFPADRILIYVGMRPLLGTTLGQGGPGGVGISLTGGGLPTEWVAAVRTPNRLPMQSCPAMGAQW